MDRRRSSSQSEYRGIYPHDLPPLRPHEEGGADGRGDEKEQEEGPYRMETRALQPPDH